MTKLTLHPQKILALLAAFGAAGCYWGAASSPNLIGALLGMLTPLPLWLAALGLGVKAGLLASLISAAILAFGGIQNAAAFLIMFAIPIGLASVLALQFKTDAQNKVYWSPPERPLLALTFYATAILLLVFIALELGADKGLAGLMDEVKAEALRQIQLTMPAEQQPENMLAALEGLLRIMPGILMVGWVGFVLFWALIAQNVLQRQGHALRSNFELADLHLPRSLTLVCVALGLISLLPLADGYRVAAINLSILLSTPFFFMGLAVMHAVANRNGAKRWYILAPTYGLLLLFFWPMAVLLSAVGILEPWCQLRQLAQRGAAANTH